MKKIGVSIPWDYIADNIATKDGSALHDIFGQSDRFLIFLKDLEVTHIELRHRKKDISETDMSRVFKKLFDFGFSITVHGDSLQKRDKQSITMDLPWFEIYRKISKTDIPIMVTLHPVTGSDENALLQYNRNTVQIIQDLSRIISNEELPLKLALENQRSKRNSITGTSFKDIDSMWKEINRENVGICWDMGHCVANNIIDEAIYPLHPHTDFIAAATHTHIHDIGHSGSTHWFFKENIVPLSDYVQSLKSADYKGIYNLEFSFSRFRDDTNQREYLEKSILKLRDLI